MKKITSLLLISAIAFAGCKMFGNDKEKKDAAVKKQAKEESKQENTDLDFQGFIGRLKKAVAAHDTNTLTAMMADNFLYVLGSTQAEDRTGEGGAFKYWDENGLWAELDGILSERFAKKGEVWVAPPQFADPTLNYTGYRAGISRVKGSWKFVYFVTGSTND